MVSEGEQRLDEKKCHAGVPPPPPRACILALTGEHPATGWRACMAHDSPRHPRCVSRLLPRLPPSVSVLPAHLPLHVRPCKCLMNAHRRRRRPLANERPSPCPPCGRWRATSSVPTVGGMRRRWQSPFWLLRCAGEGRGAPAVLLPPPCAGGLPREPLLIHRCHKGTNHQWPMCRPPAQQ